VCLLVLTQLTVAGAAGTPKAPPPCSAAFPGARETTIGRTTWYNRQSSVQSVVCFGFGLNPSADFPISAGMVCGLVAQAIGSGGADKLGLFVDGACSGASIAADPREPTKYVEVACSWVSDLLTKLAAPAGIAAGLGCTFAPSAGHALGALIESKHELDVASAIIDRGQCLKYSPTHFGSAWLAVACATDDRGFSTLPPAPTTGGRLTVGSSFASWCVVAWPTAPTITANSIEMTMSCAAVPEGEYLFTDVIYGNPHLPISPDHARAYVVGKIIDIARSEEGYSELVVQASSVKVQ